MNREEKPITDHIRSIVLNAVLLILISLYNALAWGFVLYKYWTWFIIPVFNTLQPISYAQSIGLMLFVGLFGRREPHTYVQDKDKAHVTSKAKYFISLGLL